MDQEPFEPASTTNYYPKAARASQRRLRQKWYKFDPRYFHAVEPIKGGRRVSRAFTKKHGREFLLMHLVSSRI